MDNGKWKMENDRSGGACLRPIPIMNYRRGNPCGYPLLWDNHNPFSSMAGGGSTAMDR